jgi:folate-binding protein YgfZ
VAAAREGACFAWRRDLTVLALRGADVLDLCGRLSAQDLAPLSDGRAVATLFLSPEGRVLHRTLLAPEGDRWLALDEPAGPGVEPLPAWIERYTFAEDATASPLAGWSVIALVGPAGRELARHLAGPRSDDGAVRRDGEGCTWVPLTFGPLPAVFLAGPAGALEEHAAWLRARPRVVEADEEAWRQLRVEAGVPAGGAEIDGAAFPAECGLLADVSFSKGCYTGQEVVARQDTYGKVARRLVGLRFDSRPAVGLALGTGPRDGRVTSVAPEPLAEGDAAGRGARWLALGFVRARDSEPGARIAAQDGTRATVVELPTARLR